MISQKNRLFAVAIIASSMCISAYLFPMQQTAGQPTVETLQAQMEALSTNANRVLDASNNSIHRVNQAMGLAHSANGTSINAFERATQALGEANRASNLANEVAAALGQAREIPTQVAQLEQDTMRNLTNEHNRLRNNLANFARAQNEIERENTVHVETAKIQEMNRLGLFEQKERIRAQGFVDAETTKWDKIQAMIDDPKRIIKIVLAIAAIALVIYGAKYGIPMLVNYMTQPHVISETSKSSWFGSNSTSEEIRLEDLIFAPPLQTQLFDLVLRIQSAKTYNENLPNVLFYGVPGTGKTAFAKALAYYSGLDYALTSGSEFAKITDLNTANNELRKLLEWGQNNDDTGLIIFVDEAESLFANRKLATTSKAVQDFINTFLALVPEKSQKNLMFIFATNHPFKLDDAILNRIGINIEFTLPEAPEREKILGTYLAKFAQENENAWVDIHPEILQGLSGYADKLKGLSPRDIKFVAEEMIVSTRRQTWKQLTHDVAQTTIDQALHALEQTQQWKKEREEWVKAHMMVPA